MIVKKTLAIAFGICFLFCFAAVLPVIHEGIAWQRAKKTAQNEEMQEKMLAWLLKRTDAAFDVALAAQELDLTYRQLACILLELKEKGQIVSTPKDYARKPILISFNDVAWNFWQVSVISGD